MHLKKFYLLYIVIGLAVFFFVDNSMLRFYSSDISHNINMAIYPLLFLGAIIASIVKGDRRTASIIFFLLLLSAGGCAGALYEFRHFPNSSSDTNKILGGIYMLTFAVALLVACGYGIYAYLRKRKVPKDSESESSEI